MSDEGRLQRDEEALLERLVAGEELDLADRTWLGGSDDLGRRASALQSVIARLDVEGARDRRALANEEKHGSGEANDLAQERIHTLVKARGHARARTHAPAHWLRPVAVAAAVVMLLVVWRGQGDPPVAPSDPPMLSGAGVVGDLLCEPGAGGETLVRWRGELPPGGFFELRLWAPGDEYIQDPIFQAPPLRTAECTLNENELVLLPDRVFAEITVRGVDGAVVGTSTESLSLR